MAVIRERLSGISKGSAFLFLSHWVSRSMRCIFRFMEEHHNDNG